MLEKDFQKQVIADLEKLPQTWVLKTSERARHGIPDLLVCARGHFFAIELKTDEGYATKLQELSIDRINRAGGVAFISRPVTWPTHYQILKEKLTHALHS